MPKTKEKHKCHNSKAAYGTGGFFYFLGFLGSAVYYIQAADSFWGGVFGFIKALFWPAFVVYDALRFIGVQ